MSGPPTAAKTAAKQSEPPGDCRRSADGRRRTQPGGSRKSADRDGDDDRASRLLQPAASGCRLERRSAGRPREKITPYDFKRPERVGKEQMRALQTLHEGFGRNFGAALSALLRSIVEVKLTSVDQLTYSEFVFSLENPTCFNLLRPSRWKAT